MWLKIIVLLNYYCRVKIVFTSTTSMQMHIFLKVEYLCVQKINKSDYVIKCMVLTCRLGGLSWRVGAWV